MFFQSFLTPAIFFFMLLRTFLSKEPSETLNSSKTFDFLVSVRISSLRFIIGLFECFCGWGRPIRFCKGFPFSFPRFCHWWDVKTSKGDFFYLLRVSFPSSLNEPQSDPLFFFYFILFACRMERGCEDVSSSHDGRRRTTHWETPIVSNLVAAMFAEINLEMLDGSTASTVGEADNVIYFTREQFTGGLRFHVPSSVK